MAMFRRGGSRRVLATVLFTDIVGSTARAAELGDARWRAVLRDHHRLIRRLLKRHHGREVDTAGDGFFATFEQPADAIACAIEGADAVEPLGIAIRAGIHTGEVEPMGAKVGGMAVHIAARILGAAEPGQILASSTVRDLVTGAGFTFVDAGTRELKGVADAWHLYAIQRPARESTAEPAMAEAPAWGALPRAVLAVGVVALIALSAGVTFILSRGGMAAAAGPNVVRLVNADGSLGTAFGVGRGPGAMATDSQEVWVANTLGGTVSRVTAAAGQDAVVGAGAPLDIAVTDGLVWSLDPFANTVLVISGADAAVTQTIDVHGRAIAASGSAVWVADDIADVVHRIDPGRRAVTATIALPAGSGPWAIAASGDAVWVVNALTGTVSRIDATTNEVDIDAIAVASPPSAVAASADAVWVASEADDVVIRLDPASGRVLGQEATCDGPTDLAIAGRSVVVACSAGHAVWRITSGEDPVRTAVEGIPVGVATAGDEVWVTIRES
jgi:class 3 adenylate cyclase